MVYDTKNIKNRKEAHKIYKLNLEEVKKYLGGKNIEQEYTDYYINKYGYNNVRGGKYTNSNTLQKPCTIICTNCNNPGHYAYNCSKNNKDNYISYDDDY